MNRAPVLLALALSLTGCGESVPVVGDERAEVEAFITEDYGYRSPLEFGSMWKARARPDGELICGDFESPPEFGGDPPRLRFYYDTHSDHGQTEMHRLWVTESMVSEAILDQNRALFDTLWSEHCAPYRPGSWW